jgi:hypothetical protein
VFTIPWHPPGPGTYKLGCRAIDDHGAVQLPDNDPTGPRALQPDPHQVAHVKVPERRKLPPGP